MKTILGSVLVVIAATIIALGQAALGNSMHSQKSTMGQSSRGMGASSELTSAEHAWVNAAIAGDADKVAAALDDGWVGIGPDGQKQTKAEYIADVKSGKSKLEKYDMGHLTVRTYGSVAIVTGSDTEKSSYAGRDTSGKFAWTDVFVKRDGKWKAVSSEITKVSGQPGGF